MNAIVAALLGATAAGGLYLVLRADDKPEASGPLPEPPAPRRAEPGMTPSIPTPTLPPIVPLPGEAITTFTPPPVPPSPIPIPGGSYIQNIGYCPPGYSYNLATKQCEFDSFGTQGCKDCNHE
jgi:hypothetical protein